MCVYYGHDSFHGIFWRYIHSVSHPASSTGIHSNMAKANGKGGAQPTAKFMPHQRLAHIRNAQQLLATTRPPERLIILG